MSQTHSPDSNRGVPERIQLMNEKGELTPHADFSTFANELTGEDLKDMYRTMAVTRRFDDEMTALQRQGQLALWVPSRGQEAAQVASARALAPNDYIFPSYRDHGVLLQRGVQAAEITPLFRGSGTLGWDAKKHNVHSYTLVLAAQVIHATGYAMGLNLDAEIEAETGQATEPTKDADRPAVVTYFGDGSTTEGDVHESMVFAASYNAPVLFFVQNNHWAISVPFSVQSRVPVATRAAGYGFEGLRVDGNDVLAVYAATRYAMTRIRAGEGPVLIEAETYRLGPHTTADDPTKYRPEDHSDIYHPLDPMIRLEAYLRDSGVADEAFFESVTAEAKATAQTVRDAVLAGEPEDFETYLDRAYSAPHQQVEDDRAFYRTYTDGFEEE
ncbi:pyruvate dehydrogenase (acetyl-transferring) E1 component subunit alpha [Rothia nasimurium]|uniref:2-oxoisovalerate dehydrogenase subunit alpha n=1 Tax=Rothia nasimurium TaxID=85336 RepID=A0A1Y1RNY8_9MICC|nr:thiamine pyrophosphate-dependent enzyme [Rothia nasimurium]ORC16528.1 pyruvate dehydrogenase (acetyl-transferring) E1 component subunit alpha [Rothia nasimurium]